MLRSRVKHILPAAIGITCVVWVIMSFDWPTVFSAVAKVDIGKFLAITTVAILIIQSVRGLRWLLLLRVPLTWGHFVQSFLVNGASSGLAALTPLQVGELIKAKLLPSEAVGGHRWGLSAVLLERALDLCGLVAVGLAGWFLQVGNWPVAIGCLLLVPLLALSLAFVRSRVARLLPGRFHPYLEIFNHLGRLLTASMLTLPIWGLYALLWWAAAYSMDVTMSVSQSVMLVGTVMLAIVATMVPSGIGVSEVASRNVLVWSGMTVADAEAVAIALRLITPVLVVTGSLCAVSLSLRQRK